MEQMNMEQVQTQAITAEEVSQRIQEAIEQARAEWERAQAENQRIPWTCCTASRRSIPSSPCACWADAGEAEAPFARRGGRCAAE